MIENLLNAASTIVFFISSYVPKLISGLLVLSIGVIVASLLKDLMNAVFQYFRIEGWLEKAGFGKPKEVHIWPQMLAELIRWTTIFIFLMSAVEIWDIPKVGDVINQLLMFLPNVFVSVVIGWVGLIAARFAYSIVRHGIKGLGKKETVLLGNIARYSIIFFTVLIILTQLGIAADLVKILFTGIIGMLALAGGLAFGLGGKEEARTIIQLLIKRLESSSDKPPKSKTIN